MGAPFPEPPGRAASTYRSDQMAFATAKVPDRALAAKAFVETHYRGADFLGARGASWNASTATRPEPLRGMRRDEAFAKCLSTTRDGLRIKNKTPRPFGFGGDPLGATVSTRASRATTKTQKSTKSAPVYDSDASAAREASRRETVYDARVLDSGITKGALGAGHRSIAFEKRFCHSSYAPGGWSGSVDVSDLRDPTSRRALHEASRLEAAAARRTSETILRDSAKRYVSPFRAEVMKQATIRSLKVKGEWPNPKPPIVVHPATRRSGTKKADLRAVADLDAFDPDAFR